ncbi:sensor histidine kinase [Persicitalea jodogahamensis]|uniref:Histidine kinase n=1 Tax=Persicitalea jodogahamensis TaxID=402147 RepID=A0A8J3G8B6_9BACT|nr:histidine kinase [Persicitalea jodogahamensis]GHB57555.1 histidine kinase [Persicitalea jodogahamensis]
MARVRSSELRYVWVYGLVVGIMVNLAPIVRCLSDPVTFESVAGYGPGALALKVINCFLFGRLFSLISLGSLGPFSNWFQRQEMAVQRAIEFVLFVVLTEFFFQLHLFLLGPSLHEGVMHFWYFAQNLAQLVGVYGFWYYVKAVRESNEALIENEQLKRLEVKNQLDALNSQLNPHFLFNALNILNISITTDPDKAQSIVHNLSDILRYNLKIQKQNLVRLSEELAVARAFLELYKARFGEKLVFNFERTNINKEWYVVPLSLQLLIENAIKHNIITSNHILHLKVEVDEVAGQLVISNSINRKPHTDGLGIGLSNLNKRYELISGRITSLSDDSEHFSVTIPLIESP